MYLVYLYRHGSRSPLMFDLTSSFNVLHTIYSNCIPAQRMSLNIHQVPNNFAVIYTPLCALYFAILILPDTPFKKTHIKFNCNLKSKLC